MPQIDLRIEAGAWPDETQLLALAEKAMHEACKTACAFLKIKLKKTAEISVLFSDDVHVKTVNQQWRGIDKPTNVLSFPAVDADDCPKALFLGDIILGYETCAREALEEQKAFSAHITHLLIHGTLHLLGFDHEDEEEAEEMEALEISAMQRLGLENPYETATDNAS